MRPKMETNGKDLCVWLEGELDHHYAGEVRDRIDECFDRSKARNIVFDFSGVSFMDSSGIGMVIGRYKNAVLRGGSVTARGMNQAVRRIFDMSGLMKIIKVEDKAGGGNFND